MDGELYEITRCEVCGNENLRSVLNLGRHPMCDDLVAFDEERHCKLFPIEIMFCDDCTTAHQRFQIPKQELFPVTYHYRSRHTSDVLDGMTQLVAACETELGPVADKKILDVGCNDGSLLSAFRERGATKTFGIEPTGAVEDARARGHEILQAFLTEDIARDFIRHHGNPDIITFTNVFAHIEDLPAVIRSLLILCHEGTTIVIENHYLGAVIERRQFDTFYHEHPRTYSYASFARIASSLRRGIAVAEFPQRYGGNIRVMLRPEALSKGPANAEAISQREESFGMELLALGRDVEVWQSTKRAQLEAAVKQHGKLSAKAFPGRSAIPVTLLGLDETMISAVYEKPTSGKIGHFVPGTRIPIRSDDDLDAASVEGPIVNMAWHIGHEIRSYMRDRGYSGDWIDIISAGDFVAP